MEFDEDTARALARLRGETGMGVSQAVNHLMRHGLQAAEQPPFVQRTHPLGLRIDVTSVADAIEDLESPTAR